LIDDGEKLVATERLLKPRTMPKADGKQRGRIASETSEGDSLRLKHLSKLLTERSAGWTDVDESDIGSLLGEKH
jgi:hypothetical protein